LRRKGTSVTQLTLAITMPPAGARTITPVATTMPCAAP
jgi:hypothetical protein